MALQKLLPKFFFIGFTGLTAATGVNYITPFISTKMNVKESNDNPGILVESKNSNSNFIELIKSDYILEIFKTYKNNLLIPIGSTLIGCTILYNIGVGNIMYATKNQLKNGVVSLTNNIDNFRSTFQSYKKKVFEKLGYLDEKIDQNQKNIELVVKQKSDELKCEMKDLKSGQLKTNGMLDLMTDKINIIENQGKYISKGVFLLCNTVINNERFDENDETIQQLKIYNDFNNKKKVTDKNTL
jgi:hypothetical protein